ncbi:hypothetical protein BDW22DRAFT_248120 [Trametopsis cervina]|nr:hypothetical protein BDW22DRAFT_248120 [Trametopsis cervina]
MIECHCSLGVSCLLVPSPPPKLIVRDLPRHSLHTGINHRLQLLVYNSRTDGLPRGKLTNLAATVLRARQLRPTSESRDVLHRLRRPPVNSGRKSGRQSL